MAAITCRNSRIITMNMNTVEMLVTIFFLVSLYSYSIQYSLAHRPKMPYKIFKVALTRQCTGVFSKVIAQMSQKMLMIISITKMSFA